MNCTEAIALMVDRAEGGIDTRDAKRLEAHIAGCRECAESAREFDASAPLTSTLKQESLAVQVPDSLDMSIRAAVEAAGRRRTAFWKMTPLRVLAAAGAAAALIAVIIMASMSTKTMDTTVNSTLPITALIDTDSVYEPLSAAEYEAEIEGVFARAVSRGEAAEMLDMLDDIPLEDQLYDLDVGSLGTLEKMLKHANGNKSG
ncbi:MAG: zf-HC2 domain-containing protein [Myxococcota bacterium]